MAHRLSSALAPSIHSPNPTPTAVNLARGSDLQAKQRELEKALQQLEALHARNTGAQGPQLAAIMAGYCLVASCSPVEHSPSSHSVRP